MLLSLIPHYPLLLSCTLEPYFSLCHCRLFSIACFDFVTGCNFRASLFELFDGYLFHASTSLFLSILAITYLMLLSACSSPVFHICFDAFYYDKGTMMRERRFTSLREMLVTLKASMTTSTIRLRIGPPRSTVLMPDPSLSLFPPLLFIFRSLLFHLPTASLALSSPFLCLRFSPFPILVFVFIATCTANNLWNSGRLRLWSADGCQLLTADMASVRCDDQYRHWWGSCQQTLLSLIIERGLRRCGNGSRITGDWSGKIP